MGSSIDTFYANDNAGQFIGAKDPTTSQEIDVTLDPLGRPTNVFNSESSLTVAETKYNYTAHQLVRIDPSSTAGSYTFTLDNYGRQSALTDPLTHPSGNQFGWTYGAAGAVTSKTDPTGSDPTIASPIGDNVTAYTYDPLGRLTAQSTTATGVSTPRVSYANSYNDAGNVLGQAVGDPGTGTTTYSYDALGRITGYTPPTGVQPQTYDWATTPDRTSITFGTGTPITTAFDAASKPVSDTINTAYMSDLEGRLTSMAGPNAAPGQSGTTGQHLVYDVLGRLSSVSAVVGGSWATVAAYTYDPLDRLLTVTENDATTTFLYVGMTNAVAATQTGTTTVDHATDLTGTELYECDSSGSNPSYLGRNSHGDVTWTADAASSGAVGGTATYDPFGNVTKTGSIPSTRWQSSWQDDVTGLYYVVARWYAPTLGTFLSTDPLSGQPSNPQTIDPYAYVAGNPLGGVDPLGTCTWDTVTMSCTDQASAPVWRGSENNYDQVHKQYHFRMRRRRRVDPCVASGGHAAGCGSSGPQMSTCQKLGTYQSCGGASPASGDVYGPPLPPPSPQPYKYTDRNGLAWKITPGVGGMAEYAITIPIIPMYVPLDPMGDFAKFDLTLSYKAGWSAGEAPPVTLHSNGKDLVMDTPNGSFNLADPMKSGMVLTIPTGESHHGSQWVATTSTISATIPRTNGFQTTFDAAWTQAFQSGSSANGSMVEGDAIVTAHMLLIRTPDTDWRVVAAAGALVVLVGIGVTQPWSIPIVVAAGCKVARACE